MEFSWVSTCSLHSSEMFFVLWLLFGWLVGSFSLPSFPIISIYSFVLLDNIPPLFTIHNKFISKHHFYMCACVFQTPCHSPCFLWQVVSLGPGACWFHSAGLGALIWDFRASLSGPAYLKPECLESNSDLQPFTGSMPLAELSPGSSLLIIIFSPRMHLYIVKCPLSFFLQEFSYHLLCRLLWSIRRFMQGWWMQFLGP